MEQMTHFYHQGRYPEAITLAEKIVGILEKALGPDHPATVTSLNDLAVLYYSTGSYAKAEPLFRRSLSNREKNFGPDHPNTGKSLNNLAMVYFAMGAYAEAEPLFKRSLAIREKVLGPDHPNTAQSLISLAQCHENMGSYTKAVPLYERALFIRKKALGPNHPDTAEIQNILAVLYYKKGLYTKAEPLLERSLFIREKALGPDHPDTAQSLNNLAMLYKKTGSYAKAEPLYKRALAIYEKTFGPNHQETAISLSNLADVYYSMGSYTKAEPLVMRSLAIREKALGPDHPETAQSINNLAELYKNMGAYAKAEPLYKRSLAIWEKALGPEHPDTATSLHNLAGFYGRTGSYLKAEPLYNRSLSIREKILGPHHPDTAASLDALAILYFIMGSYAKAEPLCKRSLAIWEKTLGPDHPNTAISLNILATLNANVGRFQAAFNLFEKAQAIDLKMILQVIGFTSESMALNYLTTRQYQLHAALGLVCNHLGQDAASRKAALNWWISRKGILLEAQKRYQEALVYTDDPQVAETFQELARVRRLLSRLTFSGPGKQGAEAYREKMDLLKAQEEKLEGKLSRMSRAFAQTRKKQRADADQVAAALAPGSVLLEFARILPWDFKKNIAKPARYLAFLLFAQNSGDVKLMDLGPAQTIDRAVAGLHEAMENQMDAKGAGVTRQARELYDLVIAKLRPQLGDVREIFISPDGQLNLIPFEILKDPAGRWLIQDFTFNYLAAARDVMDFGKIKEKPGKSLVMGDPNFDLEKKDQLKALDRLALKRGAVAGLRATDMGGLYFSPLPGTRKEAEAVFNILGQDQARLFLDDQALEAILLQMRQPPEFLHLATHGFFLEDEDLPSPSPDRSLIMAKNQPSGPSMKIENPLIRSGLALAGANQALASDDLSQTDGLFTAEKVLGLRLRGTDLVVLSACETATGEIKNGEGVYGLRRAFVQAGTKGLIMSMWAVPDVETQELMVRFYKNIQSKKMSRAKALRNAALHQMEMVKSRYGCDHPFYWGAFVYLGHPD